MVKELYLISDKQMLKKLKTFDYDVDEQAEVLEKPPEEDIEAIENESEVIKFSTAVVAEAIKSGVSIYILNHIDLHQELDIDLMEFYKNKNI